MSGPGGVPGGLRAAAAGRLPQSGGEGSGAYGGVKYVGSPGGVGRVASNEADATPFPFPADNNNLNVGGSVSVSVRGEANDDGEGTEAAAARGPDTMMTGGVGGGAFGTRVWQPKQAPDAVAVDALMLGPPVPRTKDGDGPENERTARMEEDDGLVVRQRPRARADNTARRKQRAARETHPHRWFDPEDGGLRCQADPVPPGGERTRPARWFDPGAPYLQTVPATDAASCDDAMVAIAGGVTGIGIARVERTYRLEVHAGRLEFSCHPLMGKEDYLAAQLEEVFRGYKRREASGLVALYAAKSAAAGRGGWPL